MDEKRVLIIKTDRNLILSRLLACSPGSLAGEQLYRVMVALSPEYTKTFCVRDLYYLERRGLVERMSPHTGRVDGSIDWKEARWRVTPRGDEVANHLVADPALDIERFMAQQEAGH